LPEIDIVNPLLIEFYLGSIKDYNIILESRYEECFIPVRLILVNCNSDSPVTDEVLFIVSKADKLEYHNGCVYIIFEVSYVAEVINLLSMISNKLGIGEKVNTVIKDHAFVEEHDE
jgi:hypothetical protein